MRDQDELEDRPLTVGDIRTAVMKCQQKHGYPTFAAARRAGAAASLRSDDGRYAGMAFRVYKCSICGAYHVTTHCDEKSWRYYEFLDRKLKEGGI